MALQAIVFVIKAVKATARQILIYRSMVVLYGTSPDYALVTAIERRALQSEGNESVPWSGLQTELLERMPGKMRAPSQAPKTALKLFVSVPSLLQAHPSIDTVS